MKPSEKLTPIERAQLRFKHYQKAKHLRRVLLLHLRDAEFEIVPDDEGLVFVRLKERKQEAAIREKLTMIWQKILREEYAKEPEQPCPF